jgi:hypothetical protein
MPNGRDGLTFMKDALAQTIKRNTPVATVGLKYPGNIDLYNRPHIPNPDGKVSTVRSASFGLDGGETLIPTISDTALLSDKQSLAQYQRTGKHLGIFATPEDANAYAGQLHEDYESGKYDLTPSNNRAK